MQSSLFEPGRLVIFTCSTGDRVDATMKGPSEKGDQFAVSEYMKGGQMVTHPCAPLPRIEFRHLQVVSMCNCSTWCMIVRRVSKPNICRLRILHCLCQHGQTSKAYVRTRCAQTAQRVYKLCTNVVHKAQHLCARTALCRKPLFVCVCAENHGLVRVWHRTPNQQFGVGWDVYGRFTYRWSTSAYAIIIINAHT